MSSPPDSPKRFVAGAKCPQCMAQDKVVMYRQGGVQYRECVSCGYHDQMHFEQQFRELETRVNHSAGQLGGDVSVVRLLDPDLPGKS